MLEVFNKQGNIATNKTIGDVELVKSGAKSTMLHGFGKNKIAAIPAIKSVIENGNVISYAKDYNDIYDRYIIAAKGIIDSKPAILGVVINSYKNNGVNKFYLHEAEIIEANSSSMTGSQISEDTVNEFASTDSIRQTSEESQEKFSMENPLKNGIYDYSKTFAEQVDDYKSGLIPKNDTLLVSDTPNIWQKVGFNALPVTINQTHIKYALNGTKDIDHNIGEALLKKLPEYIKSPLAIIQSQTHPDRAVVILNMMHNGKNVISAIEVDGNGRQNNIVIDSNALTTLFAKGNALEQLQKSIKNTLNGNSELFYWNKKEAVSLLQKRGLQLPNVLPQDGFANSIRNNLSKVKTKINELYNSADIKNTADNDGGVRYDFGVTQNEINEYIAKAKSKENTEDYKKYADASKQLVSDVSKDFDLTGYSHALRDNDIRHIFISHGEKTNEKYPVTEKDVELIPYIVQNYDKVYYRLSKKGKPSILYVMATAGNNVYFVEQAIENYNGESLLINKQMIKTGSNDIPSVYVDTILKKESKDDFLADLNKARKEHAQSVNQTYSTDSIRQTSEESQEKFSVSSPLNDSDGNILSKGQQEYFKDSKVRDKDGNLLVMYHGTPNADFTVFNSGTYFTQNKEYADRYQSQGASSLGYKKTANNPDTYSVYLNIKKPFDTRNKTERDIFNNEYYHKYGTGTALMESGLPDWLDGMDLQEFLEEKGYDYDGLILDEGATGGYGEDVKSRGVSYVIFDASQIKKVANASPSVDFQTEAKGKTFATTDIISTPTQESQEKFSMENPLENTQFDTTDVDNQKEKSYNKKNYYNETETLFLQWQNSSAPVGEVKKFFRFRKHRFYEKTADGCIELSAEQYKNSKGGNLNESYKRANRKANDIIDNDEIAKAGNNGNSGGTRNPRRTALVSKQTFGEKLRNDTGGSLSGVGRSGDGTANGINQNNDSKAESNDPAFSMPENDEYSTVNPLDLRYNPESFARSLIRQTKSTADAQNVSEKLKETITLTATPFCARCFRHRRRSRTMPAPPVLEFKSLENKNSQITPKV